ncbi:MAG: hypothetical protein GXY80_12185 [Syntrophorhabdus aromaticivorans]|uniref:Ysc84 actin-binding domain-containing protein n=1 Tax=Syntrophorhabdus aromaticivorans TaxID=328301 RepID=A0A971M6S6_9BACT|nr:hypothetical protein [Syntrophorhabdus aromaticivorans]
MKGKEGKSFSIINGFMVCLALIVGFLFICPAHAGTAQEINASVNVALKRFTQEVKGGQEFLNASKGVLVMPRVKKAGFVVGGQYGEGALMIAKKTVGYYNLIAGSVGFQIGAQEMNIILCFMDEKALGKFRSASGWEAGVDGNITLVNVGAGGSIDTTKIKEPIVGFVFGQKGLMADVSLKGAKFTKVKK